MKTLCRHLCAFVVAAPLSVFGQDANYGFDGRLQCAEVRARGAPVSTLVVQPDGKILVGGRFTAAGGQARKNLARLNADGTLDAGFGAWTEGENEGWVRALVLQPDGKILVGGTFDTLAGQPHHGMGRLNPDGRLDMGFDIGFSRSDGVRCFVVQSDGKLVIGGEFSEIGGQPRRKLARLNPDGSLGDAFPGASDDVHCLAVQPDGRILVGGGLAYGLGRLHPDGSVDISFNAGVSGGDVECLLLQPDGKIVVAGLFTTLGGKSRSYLGRLNSDGSLDESFTPVVDAGVNCLAAQSDGKMIVAGGFSWLCGQLRPGLGRLHPDGSLDTGFTPGVGGDRENPYFDFGLVEALAVQPDGKILVGGWFTGLCVEPRNFLGRLNPDGSLDQASWGPFLYLNINDEILIKRYRGVGGEVTIPEAIDGLPVTSILSFAFSCLTNISSIKIPNSVVGIGWNVFEYCSALTNVTMGAGVRTIEGGAFWPCPSLMTFNVDPLNTAYASLEGVLFNKNLTTLIQYPGAKTGSYLIPNTVLSIDKLAFAGCTGLTGVAIPASLTRIGAGAFADCSRLTGVIIPDNVSFIDGGAFGRCSSLRDLFIPDSIDEIGEYTFHGCTGLTNITIGANVTSIRDCAFKGCTGLTSVTIPDNVATIGVDVFYDCSSLTNITLGKSVISIGDSLNGDLITIAVNPLNPVYSSVDGILFNKNQTTVILCPRGRSGSYSLPEGVIWIKDDAFRRCYRLTSITLPNSVTSIGEHAFDGCESVTCITLPERLTHVGDGAFSFCASLTSIDIPGGPTHLGPSMFAGCGSLTNVNIPDGVTSFGDSVFEGCQSLTSLTVPMGVTNIGRSAFHWCTGLTNVSLPNTITSIGSAAFASCTNLTAVYCAGNAPELESAEYLFDEANRVTVYFLAGTAGWSSTFGGRPTAPWLLANPLILCHGPEFGVQTNGFTFVISWATNKSLVVEVSLDLTNPAWSPLATNSLAAGSSYFSDPQWSSYDRRFYRIRSP